ncbi:MAG: SIS domain-containing protein [Clostridia bacterium]|nr:SIS domain-containing protein [Clostridia bacterium]
MSFMYSEISEVPRVLRSVEKVNDVTLGLIASEVRKRGIDRVVFAGRGTSDHAGIYGQYLFQIICSMSAGLAASSVTTLYGAENCYRGCLVIALSQSGRAADGIAVVKAAKKCGSVTVSVTNDSDSPLASETDYCLVLNAGKEYSVAATKTFSSELSVIYLLAQRIAGNNDKGALMPVADTVESMISSLQKPIKDLASRYADSKGGFILSRGVLYPIALEFALKIQETSYLRMKGSAVSDFYHGPVAMVSPDTDVIVLVPKGKTEKAVLEMADYLIALGNDPLIITDDPAICDKYHNVFVVPGADDELLTPVIMASFVQLFALFLCESRGGDPDSPRYLNKVTVTR